jgi:chromosome segregation ATPase
MTWLKLVPAWAYWALAVLLVLGVQQIRVTAAHMQASAAITELATYRAEVSEMARRVTLAALHETQRRMTAADEVQKDAEQQIELARADAARAGTALGRLQQRLDNAERRSRAAGNALTDQLSAATEAQARMRAELFGGLGEAAGFYAGEADERGIRGRACERQYESLRNGNKQQ